VKENKEKAMEFFCDIERFPMLCQSCGMCENVCPVEAIKLSQNFATQFVPEYDEKKCIGCMKCVKACPVRKNMSEHKSVMGPYIKVYLGKSMKESDVENGSSGGVITALLTYGLETKVFDEVLTVSNTGSVVTAKPVYTVNPGQESGSKYVSEPLCTIYDSKKKNLAITALPCQAKAIRKQNDDNFIFGLFCSKLSLEDLINYVVLKNKKNPEDITEITYRRGNWPGKFRVKFADGSQICEKLNRSVFNSAYNSYNFSCSGCLLCDDYFAEQADISFGDPWGRTQYQDGYPGETVIIVRTDRGMELVDNAVKDGILSVEELDVEKVIKGHIKEIYNKKTALIQRIRYMDSRTDAMKEYNKDVLIPAKNFGLLNTYAIGNNWKRRKSIKRYKKIFKSSIRYMFFKRFAHAFLLSKRLKMSKNYETYLECAKNERTQSGR